MTYTIFADIETDGLHEDCQVIQLAAIAVDESFAEVASFERKVAFDEFAADAEALKVNHYTREAWSDAPSPRQVVQEFNRWMEPYRSIQMVSKKSGKPYSVAKLAGHNFSTFDLPRLRRMYGESFFPCGYHAKDTLQRALWFFDEHPERARPESLKLSVLAAYFGIATDGAHDALVDVRLSAAIARAIQKAERHQ